MRDHAALPGSLGINLQWDFFVIGVVAFISPLAGKAGEASQPPGSTQHLNISIEYLIGGGPLRRVLYDFDFVRIFHRNAVLVGEARGHFGMFGASVARVTS